MRVSSGGSIGQTAGRRPHWPSDLDMVWKQWACDNRLNGDMRKFGTGTLGALAAVVSTPRFVPICFAGFVLIRLSVLLLLPITPASDSAWYVGRAMEIANGEGYHEG